MKSYKTRRAPRPYSTITPHRLAESAGRLRTVFGAAAAAAVAIPVLAQGPQGANVVAGNASINHNGANTVITASNGAIINYQSFNINAGESVRFIQPGSTSRVLNRITGPDPSRIAGTLTANGIVYIVNRAGVYFAHGALVDVGGIYAAAGNITNRDFINNVNRFTDLHGRVENRGTIDAGAAHLVGNRVANYGAINAPGGMVTMSAGGEVYIGEAPAPGSQSGQVYARISGGGQGTGVTQAGQINAAGGQVRLGAGDMYAVAIDHSGSTTARNITLQGGRGGVVSVSGRLDASDRSAGHTGGTVKVLGDRVGVFGGQIDASGDSGGGTVLVGGDYQGHGPTPRASATYISPTAQIHADATRAGNGGKVVVWSDFFTNYQGSITTRGGAQGGNGGLVETSGKNDLFMVGSVDASAPHGRGGMWLLDPTDVTLSNGATSNGMFTGGVFTPDPVVTANVKILDIENALRGGTSVTINTTSGAGGNGDITLLDPLAPNLNMSNGPVTLTLNAVRDINLTGATTSQSGTDPLSVALNAGRNVNITQTVTLTNGTFSVVAGGDVSISAAINAGATGTIDIAAAGDVAIGANLLAGTSLSLHSGTDGSGNLAFASSPALRSASISLRAGDGAGGAGTTATVDALTNTPSFTNFAGAAAPTVFTIQQDGALADGAIPAAAQFGGSSVSGVTYTLQSDDGSVTLGTASKVAGSSLSISGATGVTVTPAVSVDNLDLTSGADVTLTGGATIAAGGSLNSMGVNFTSGGAIATSGSGGVNLSHTGAVTLGGTVAGGSGGVAISGAGVTQNAGASISSTSTVSITGTDAVAINDSISAPTSISIQSGTDGTGNLTVGAVNLDSASISLRAGDGAGGTNTAIVDLSGGPNFRNFAGASHPGTFALRQDAAIADTSIPGAARFQGGSVAGMNYTIQSDAGAVTLSTASKVAGSALTLSGGSGVNINAALSLASLDVLSAATLNAGVTTTGDQNYTGAVSLGANIVLAANDTTFSGAVNSSGSARDLTINSSGGGTTTFGSTVGAGLALGALSTNADGTTTFSGTVNAASLSAADAVTLSGGSVTTTGDQTYGNLTLGANTLLTGNDITFAGTIDSSGGARNLTVNTSAGGATTFGGNVGVGSALATLTTNADGSTLINAAQVKGATLAFNDAVIIGADTAVTGTTSVAFASTVDCAANTPHDLTVNSPLTSFAGDIGGAANGALGALATDAAGATTVSGTVAAASVNLADAVTLSGGSVTTTGDQTYGDLTLTANTVLAGNDVTFSGSIDSSGSARNLTVNTSGGGLTTFNGDVGGALALGVLTTNADGSTRINTTQVAGAMLTFNDPVQIGMGATLIGTTAITFGSTVDSDAGEHNDLTLNTPALAFNGDVGAAAANTDLGALTTDAAGTTTINASTIKALTATFHDAVTVGVDTLVRGTNGVTFDGAVNSQANEGNDLTVNSSGATAFNGAVGAGANGALGLFQTDAPGTTTINAPTVMADTVNLQDAVTLAMNTTVTGATSVTFSGGVASQSGMGRDLVIHSPLAVISGGAGAGAGGALGMLSTNGPTMISGTITGGMLDFQNAVIVTGNSTLNGTTSVAFHSTVDSQATQANDLTINTPLLTFGGDVGNAGMDTALGALTTDAPGMTIIDAAFVKAATVAFNDAVEIDRNLVVRGTTSVAFNGTIASQATEANDLIVNSPDTTFGGDIGAVAGTELGLLQTNAAGTTTINTATINGATLNFQDNVVVAVNATVHGTTSVSFGGTIDSQASEANNLTVNSPLTTFTGDIGAATNGALGTLSTNPNGSTTINSSQVNAAILDFNDDIIIGADSILNATTSVDFAKTLASEMGEANDLTINSPSVAFHDMVGAGTGAALGLLKTGAGGTTLIDAPSMAAAELEFGNAVVVGQNTALTGTTSIIFHSTVDSEGAETNDLALTSPAIAFGGDIGNAGATTALGALSTNAASTAALNAPVVKADSVDFAGATVLGAHATITAPTSVRFGGALDSRSNESRNLTINSMDTTFAGVVGGSSGGELGNLITDAAGTTHINTGAVTAASANFHDAVVVGADSVLTCTNAVTFGSTLNSQSGQGNDLSISGSAITFSGVVGGATGGQIGNLVVDSTSLIHLDGGALTVASADFRGPILLGVSTTITADRLVTFADTLNSDSGEGNALTVDAPTTEFKAAVGNGSMGSLGSVTVRGATIASAVTTTGDQTYSSRVGLTGIVTLTGHNITFGGTLDSVLTDRVLTINTVSNGQTKFMGAVGSVLPLASITTNADGTTVLAGGEITTSGDQTYNDKVVLGAATTISANNVLFDDLLDSDGTPRALSVTAASGSTTFSSAVGSGSRLASLAVSSGAGGSGANRLNGGSVVTDGNQTYNGATLLGTDTTLSGASVTFGGTLNSGVNGRSALTVNSSGGGTTTFSGDVGASNPLLSLTTNADGRTQLFGRSVQTTQDQMFNDAVTIGANQTLSGRNVTFGSTIDATPLLGPVSLAVNASGTTTFTGVIGASTPLSSLSTDAQGMTRIGADIHTQGSIAFADPVHFFGNAVLTDTGATGISFNGAIDSEGGNHALTLLINPDSNATQSAPSIAHIFFGGDVGATSAFSSLTLGGDRSTNPTVATVFAGITPQGQPVTNFAMTINTTGAFTMGARQRLTVVGDLTINSGGRATLGDISTLGNLTVNAPSIAIRTRPGGSVLGAIVGAGTNSSLVTDMDVGTDFVAGGQINFSTTPTVVGGNLPPTFATPQAGGISSTLQGFAQRAFGDVTAGIMHVGATVLDLRSAGPSNANFAEAIAGAAPRESQSGLVSQDTAVGRAQQEELQQLGVFARYPEYRQLLDFLTGRALYNDVPEKPNPIDRDYQVTVNRLPGELVGEVLRSYRAVFAKDGTPQPERPREVLSAAWAEYAKAAGDKADPLGFRAYVEAVPSLSEAQYYLDGLRNLFTELGYLGLSPVELRIAKQTLLGAVAVPGLSQEQLEAAIMARNFGAAAAP